MMMELKAQFEQAVASSKTLPDKPSNEVLLQLYGLYKQSLEGDIVLSEPPNPFDFVAIAKHKAWEALKGQSQQTAMQQYIELVEKLKS